METSNHPPRLALRFVKWICPAHLYEGIEGDLLEAFDADVVALGERKARWQLRRRALGFFRPGIILRNRFTLSFMSMIMVRNYFTVATRNISRRKAYSFINAFGLSTGIAFCLLIYLFINDERSFDQFHENKDRLFRMKANVYRGHREGESKSPYFEMAHMSLGLAPALKSEVPGVQYATHFCQSRALLKHDDKIFNEAIAYVDADFFSMFSFPLQEGNAAKLFSTPDEVVLTPALARKYFGREDVLGQTLLVGTKPFTVMGIVQEPPANSSLQFGVLLPMQSWGAYNPYNLEHWINQGFPTFVQLQANANAQAFRASIEKITEKYLGDEMVKWREQEKLSADVPVYEMGFTKITDIHLEKAIAWDNVSDAQYSWILSGVALLILCIACINYISLALTSSAKRRMEVGIRKSMGAFQKQLVYQFGVESILLAFLSMIIGLAMVVLALPAFNSFTGKAVHLGARDLAMFIAVALGFALLVGLVAGSYPAFYLSRFKPAQVLKGQFTSRLTAGFSRPLVVMQFVLSSFLIISSVIMYRQMEFITTKDLGYNQHQVVIIPTQAGWDENSARVVDNFRARALQHPSVSMVSATDNPFAGFEYMIFGYAVKGENKAIYGYTIDPYYLQMLNIPVVQGRGFSPDMPADTVNTIVVNEALVRDMKWKDPIGQYLNFHASDPTSKGAQVIGVVKDFHFLSLEETIKPMFFSIDKNNGRADKILVKVAPQDMDLTLDQLQKDFAAVAPDKPFEYSFLDENVAKQYAAYARWMNIMGFSTAFAILISCLGLFGLAGINALNRTKEIGIRKVMGADMKTIFILLNRQYVWLALLAFVIAVPLSTYAMNRWLNNFQFHITLQWPLFVGSMAIGLLVALAAVSYHALKAARINPADTLKYE
ncbi:ABC transporter permease [Chryseolinea lacunae]|uniref:ABC transporter permease n=1 Tax=Chryseolinea lacunae TaxID=2801331 RepID=A0ABS1KZN4_9BACT|nr:ABC transporter permease [Chryseolinea lacunae]MBL0744925.1 ABC transporter permease [Chryseolinea lacunae]